MSLLPHLNATLAGVWFGLYLFTTFVVSPAFRTLFPDATTRTAHRRVLGRRYARVNRPPRDARPARDPDDPERHSGSEHRPSDPLAHAGLTLCTDSPAYPLGRPSSCSAARDHPYHLAGRAGPLCSGGGGIILCDRVQTGG